MYFLVTVRGSVQIFKANEKEVLLRSVIIFGYKHISWLVKCMTIFILKLCELKVIWLNVKLLKCSSDKT